MATLYKLLAFAAIIMLLITGMLIAVNLDSIRAVGWHFERFIAETLQLALYCMTGTGVLAALVTLTGIGVMIAKRRNEDLRQQQFVPSVLPGVQVSAPKKGLDDVWVQVVQNAAGGVGVAGLAGLAVALAVDAAFAFVAAHTSLSLGLFLGFCLGFAVGLVALVLWGVFGVSGKTADPGN